MRIILIHIFSSTAYPYPSDQDMDVDMDQDQDQQAKATHILNFYSFSKKKIIAYTSSNQVNTQIIKIEGQTIYTITLIYSNRKIYFIYIIILLYFVCLACYYFRMRKLKLKKKIYSTLLLLFFIAQLLSFGLRKLKRGIRSALLRTNFTLSRTKLCPPCASQEAPCWLFTFFFNKKKEGKGR